MKIDGYEYSQMGDAIRDILKKNGVDNFSMYSDIMEYILELKKAAYLAGLDAAFREAAKIIRA
jgi:hypothetical protein